jgi:hypothetical protein
VSLFLENIKKRTDGWWLKKVLSPVYLPVIHKLKYLSINKNFVKEGDSVLLAAHRALSEIGLFYWLEFGTLLGVYRDGKLIAHDTDIDVGVFIEDFSPKIEAALLKQGFKKVHKFEIEDGKYGIEESYEYKGVSFDIFYFTKKEDGMICHLFPFDENKNRVVRELFTSANEFKKIQWQNMEVNIPSDTDQRLRDTYGEYTIKVKDWYTPDAALNSEIIDKKCTYYKY